MNTALIGEQGSGNSGIALVRSIPVYRACYGCGVETADANGICPDCRQEISVIRDKGMRLCAITSCDRVALQGEYCAWCADEVGALDRPARRLNWSSMACVAGAAMAWLNALVAKMSWEGAVYLTATVLVEWYLLWEFRPFWAGCLQLWFGEN